MEKITHHCKYCQHCKNYGRTQTQLTGTRFESGGRTKWYCEHPEKGGFLGYGGSKYPESSQLQTIKTHPKWCPRNKEK